MANKKPKAPKQNAPITEQRLAVLLSRWAKAADANLTVKMAELRQEITAELRAEFSHPLIIRP